MHLKSRVTLGMATAAAAIGAALIPATSAGAAAPSITVTWPNQQAGAFNLQDGDVTTVTGTGFPASTTVYVSECSTLTGGAADCDQTPGDGGVAIGQTDANGGFTAHLTVRTETLGSASCGAGSTCHAVATTNPQAPDPSTNTAAADLPFDRLQVAQRTNLANQQKVDVTGGGFKPGATVYISECTSADPTKATTSCDFNSIVTTTADSNGAFAVVKYPVHTGTVGSDGSKCNPGGPCIVAATDNVTNPTSSDAHIGATVVHFASVKALSVTAKASTAHVAKGKTFKIAGKATSGSAGVAGLTVVLDKLVNGTPQKVAGTKTVSGGAYLFKLTQKKTTKYVVVITAQKGYASAVSKTVKVSTP